MSLQKENRESRLLSQGTMKQYPKRQKKKGRVFFFFSVSFCLSLHLDHCICIYLTLLLANDTRFLTEMYDYNINHWCNAIQMAAYIFCICICSIPVLITRKDRVIKAVKLCRNKKRAKKGVAFPVSASIGIRMK